VISQTYAVVGMTCSHCVNAVTEELEKLVGVRSVNVDLAAGTVDVASDSPLSVDEVRAAVDEAGYQLA
jgi:copper chaperone